MSKPVRSQVMIQIDLIRHVFPEFNNSNNQHTCMDEFGTHGSATNHLHLAAYVYKMLARPYKAWRYIWQ